MGHYFLEIQYICGNILNALYTTSYKHLPVLAAYLMPLIPTNLLTAKAKREFLVNRRSGDFGYNSGGGQFQADRPGGQFQTDRPNISDWTYDAYRY